MDRIPGDIVMAVTKTLPTDVLESIATQIGARFGPMPEGHGHFFRFDPSASRPEIGETFEVWKLIPDAIDEITRGNLDITKLTRPTGIWHHQLRDETRAFGFARSKPLGAGPDDWSVRDIFMSEVAAKIDTAINWVDRNIPDNQVEVRLLSLPAYQVEAFWFVSKDPNYADEWNDQLLIIHSRDAIDGLGPKIDSKSFLASLPRMPRGMGIR
jgi:hypothetical protein